MLGAHATVGNSLKGSPLAAVKLHKRQVWMVGLLLLALAGGWWAVQSGALSGWLSPAAPVTAAAGQIVIEQAQGGQTVPAAASGAAVPAVAAPANIATTATEAAAETATAVTTAVTTAASEPVTIAGVAGVNGASIWDDAGNLLAALDSGALVTVRASAGGGAWLSVQTAAGAGWTPASSIIAYGLGRLTSVPLPDPVAAAANTSIAATNGDDTAAAAGTDAGAAAEASAATADASAQSADAALIAQVTGVGTHLNIRSGPGADYGVIAQAGEGAAYMAVGRNAAGDWLLLQIGGDSGSTGWASASYVALSGDLQVLPVVDAAAGA